MTTRRITNALLLIVVINAAVCALHAARRPIDGDEAYYAMAARQVSEGHTPYLDFFYPQGPLLPYVYAPAVILGGHQLLTLRGLSVVLGAITVLAWAFWLRKRHSDRPVLAVIALLVLAASPGFVDWTTTVKTYALANLGATAGLVCLDRALWSRTPHRWLVAGGLALGTATSARLLYAPLALVPTVALLVKAGDSSGQARVRASLAWLGGLVAGTIPITASLVRDPDLFWFNNIQYHTMRHHQTNDGDLLGQIAAALAALGRTLAQDPFLVATLLLSAWGVWSWRRDRCGNSGRRFEHIVATGLVVHVLASLCPNPVQNQYFTATLAPLVVPLVAGGLARLPSRYLHRTTASIGVVMGLLMVATIIQPRSAVQADPVWRWTHFRRVCAKVEELTAPDDVVLAFWPGYTFETGRRVYPGLENQFAPGIAKMLSQDERDRYHVVGYEELAFAFSVDKPELVINGIWMYDLNESLSNEETANLLDVMSRRYEVVYVDGPAKLCTLRREYPR